MASFDITEITQQQRDIVLTRHSRNQEGVVYGLKAG
jgi:hypothetical protein